MDSFDRLANLVKFEVPNLLKATRITSRSKSFSSPWRTSKVTIDSKLFNHLKSHYTIGGRYNHCQRIILLSRLSSGF